MGVSGNLKKGANMSSMNVENRMDVPDNVVAKKSQMRRRSSMFDVDLDTRKSRGDSIISVMNPQDSIMDIKMRRKNFQNTYKTEPDEKPQMEVIRNTMNDVIGGTCDGMHYDMAYNSNLIVTLNSEIMKRIKTLTPSRYRLTVQTFLISKSDQDVHVASKWLWNPDHDNHVTVTYKTSSFSVITCAHFVYLE